MTKEERIAKMATIKAELDANVEKYNAANAIEDLAEMKRLDTDAADLITQYNTHAKAICYAEILEADSPIVEAVTRLSYLGIGVKDTKVDEATIRKVDDKKPRAIDLKELNAKVKGGIGAEPDWIAKAERLCYYMTYRAETELGHDPAVKLKEYQLSDIAKQVDIGKTPTSNNALLGQLQTIVNAMLGVNGEDDKGKPIPVYKCISHDIRALNDMFASTKKTGGKVTIVYPNDKTFRSYIANVCHHLVTGEEYQSKSKNIKDKA